MTRSPPPSPLERATPTLALPMPSVIHRPALRLAPHRDVAVLYFEVRPPVEVVREDDGVEATTTKIGCPVHDGAAFGEALGEAALAP